MANGMPGKRRAILKIQRPTHEASCGMDASAIADGDLLHGALHRGGTVVGNAGERSVHPPHSVDTVDDAACCRRPKQNRRALAIIVADWL